MPPKRSNRPPTPSESSEEDNYDAMMGNMARFSNPNVHREFMASLPAKIKDRVHALMGLDKEFKAMLEEHNKEIEAVAKKYEAQAAPIMARRKLIVCGDELPTKDEVEGGVPADHKGNVDYDAEVEASAPKGLDEFWLKALEHHVIISEFITDRDREALKFLRDISTCTLDGSKKGYIITFTFAENPYFEEATIAKTYHLEENFGELGMSKAECTKITWKDDLTVEKVQKKQKSKKNPGQTRVVETTKPCESFFNFFRSEDPEAQDDDDPEGVRGDSEQWYAMAETIVDKIVPYAVEYYTGEAPDGSSDLDDDEWDDEEEEEDEDEDDVPMRGSSSGRGGAGRGGYAGGRGGRGGAPAPGGKDCKQQ